MPSEVPVDRWEGVDGLQFVGQANSTHALLDSSPVRRGSRVVWVSNRSLPSYEFEPSTTKDPPCRAVMHVKSVES
ncbi:hypothetical protein TNCV_1312291 [Trichonephila clavipes]|nr:hypothetical protein TNCV_1312291 [Trichonephila clavipes]